MKKLKIVIYVLLTLIAIPFVMAIFVKKEYAVKREISISKPKEEVFGYIKFLKNQDYYSKWAMMDPAMKKSYTGTDGNVGFISAWDSEKEDVGRGEQEIKKIVEGERIDFELRFYEPFESTEAAYMTTTALSPTETKVEWGFDGKMDYPMNLMLLVMDFEKMIGDDLATGLSNLKKLLESRS